MRTHPPGGDAFARVWGAAVDVAPLPRPPMSVGACSPAPQAFNQDRGRSPQAVAPGSVPREGVSRCRGVAVVLGQPADPPARSV